MSEKHFQTLCYFPIESYAMLSGFGCIILQRFSEVTDQLGMAVLSIIPGNPLLWAFYCEISVWGLPKCPLFPENPLFPNPVLPKTSVTLPFAASRNVRPQTPPVFRMCRMYRCHTRIITISLPNFDLNGLSFQCYALCLVLQHLKCKIQ